MTLSQGLLWLLPVFCARCSLKLQTSVWPTSHLLGQAGTAGTAGTQVWTPPGRTSQAVLGALARAARPRSW